MKLLAICLALFGLSNSINLKPHHEVCYNDNDCKYA